jgi:hypothetical protein
MLFTMVLQANRHLWATLSTSRKEGIEMKLLLIIGILSLTHAKYFSFVFEKKHVLRVT